MDKNLAHYPLDVPAPHHYTFAVRDIPEVIEIRILSYSKAPGKSPGPCFI